MDHKTEKWQTLYESLVVIISQYREKDSGDDEFWVNDEARSESEQRIRVIDFELVSSELIADLQIALKKDFPEAIIYIRSLQPKQSICVLEVTHDKAELRCY